MEERAANAVNAAIKVIKATEDLGKRIKIEEKIKTAGIADCLTTSNGIHSGLTSVGFFGPNEDYTGFSSAMNKTARLQSHAGFGELLITTEITELIQDKLKLSFEGPNSIKVKNVSTPMEYYKCIFR